MQRDITYYSTDEDPRNRYVSSNLAARLSGKGYTCADQQPGGTSATGKAPGERDFAVKDKNGQEVLIYEGLNLTKFNSSYINQHIDKLINYYNPQGLRYGILVTYLKCEHSKFKGFIDKYKQHITEYAPESYNTVGDPKKIRLDGEFISCMKMEYEVGELYFTIYHIIVRFPEN